MRFAHDTRGTYRKVCWNRYTVLPAQIDEGAMSNRRRLIRLTGQRSKSRCLVFDLSRAQICNLFVTNISSMTLLLAIKASWTVSLDRSSTTPAVRKLALVAEATGATLSKESTDLIHAVLFLSGALGGYEHVGWGVCGRAQLSCDNWVGTETPNDSYTGVESIRQRMWYCEVNLYWLKNRRQSFEKYVNQFGFRNHTFQKR